MKNKTLLLIIFLSSWFVSETTAQDFWEMMTPNKDVRAMDMNRNGELFISAKDTLNGAVGVFKSVDHGNSWELSWETDDLYAPTALHCSEEFIFIGTYGHIIRSQQGQSWDTLVSGLWNIYNILHEESGPIYVCSSILSRSLDNGQTWDTLLAPNPSVEYFYDILAVSPDTLFTSTVNWLTGGGVYRSVDGGESWEWMLQGFRVTGLEQASNGDIFASGAGLIWENYGQIMVTHDRGENWEESLTMPYLAIQDMTITPEDEIYFGSVGDLYTNKGAYFSNDNGASWNHVPSEIITNTTEVYTIKALSDGYLYACANSSDLNGNVNNLYRSSDTLYTEISRISQSEELMMVYPNPATQEVTISFEVSAEQAELQILSVNGQEMFRQRVTSGSQSVLVEVPSWPQGVYIARVLSKGLLLGAVKFVVR